jgi:hypothetical protein
LELRIATALSDRGVRNSISINNNINSYVGGLRVEAGVDEHHLHQDEREGIMGGNDRALLRAEVRGIRRQNMWRVGIASSWRHFDKGRKKKQKKQAAVKTASRTCA